MIPGYVFAHGRRESHNGGPAQVGPTLTPIQYRRLKRADQRGLQLSVAGWRHRNRRAASLTYTHQASVNGNVITVRVAFPDDEGLLLEFDRPSSAMRR